MDQREKSSLSSMSTIKCSKCGCSNAVTTQGDTTWIRTVKRKHEEIVEKPRFHVPGLDISQNAHIGIENECSALREMVSNQQAIIKELSLELEEERNASSSAANEAMSMILKLQREKAEVQMEARQFKRFSEEKMAHDVEEISSLEDMLYKREQVVQSLTCEVHAYKHRMMSFGLTESEADDLLGDHGDNQSFGEIGVHVDSPICNYPPPLRHNLKDTHSKDNNEDVVDIEKCPFVEIPRGKDQMKNIETTPWGYEGDVSRPKNVLEKPIVHSPKQSKNPWSYSTNGHVDHSPRVATGLKATDCVDQVQNKPSRALDAEDDTIDRVYTIDSVHHGATYNNGREFKAPGVAEEHASIHNAHYGDSEAKKMHLKLHELEADRESLRQTIISMQNDKAQLVLLKEIAQQLSKDFPTERKVDVKKQSSSGSFSITKVFKWCMSLIFWRKRARLSKFMSGLSPNKVGLLSLIDKGPRTRHWRCLTSTQV